MQKNNPEVVLYLAASLEGFIADEHGGTDWVCDEVLYEKICREYGCICMGNTTYKEYGGLAFDGVQHIVLASKPPKKSKHDNVHFVTSAQAAVNCAQKLGFKKFLVIGGAKTNQSFMQAGVIHKVMADIHPFLLHKGVPMFGDFHAKFDFKMTAHKWYPEGFMHAEYTVGKTRPTVVAVVVRDADGNYLVNHVGKKYDIGISGDADDTELPVLAASRLSRGMVGQAEPSPLGTFNRGTRAVYMFEVVVTKPTTDAKWVSSDQLSGLAATNQLSRNAAKLYEQYKGTLG